MVSPNQLFWKYYNSPLRQRFVGNCGALMVNYSVQLFMIHMKSFDATCYLHIRIEKYQGCVIF